MIESKFAVTRALPGRRYDEVVARVRELLPAEGFGVITEIDVKATMKKKLDKDVRPYIILGACNPALAHQMLQIDPSIGVFLPCNVDVFEHEDGTVHVQAIDARAMQPVIGHAAAKPITDEIAARLQRVLDKV